MHKAILGISALLAFTLVALFFAQLSNASAPLRARFGIAERIHLLRAQLRTAADAGVVTLAQAKLSATDDIDLFVIDEFLKNMWTINNLPFDDVVNASGAGSTLTYGYTRLTTQPTAGFRAINSEYTPGEVTKTRFTVDLKPLGGAFQIDRVLNGVAAGAETALQMSQKIKASSAAFMDATINGDSGVDANSFDGLSKALTGTSTELGAAAVTANTDWSAVAFGNDTAFSALDAVDNLMSLLNGMPTVLFGNRLLLAKLRGIMRRVGAYTRDVITFNDGTTNFVEQYGNVLLVDPGTKAGTNTDIIPVTAKAANAIGGASPAGNYTDLYAVRFGLDGFHGVSPAGQPLVNQWLPDFQHAGAVKTGEVELGPVAVVLKASKAAAVQRNIRI